MACTTCCNWMTRCNKVYTSARRGSVTRKWRFPSCSGARPFYLFIYLFLYEWLCSCSDRTGFADGAQRTSVAWQRYTVKSHHLCWSSFAYHKTTLIYTHTHYSGCLSSVSAPSSRSAQVGLHSSRSILPAHGFHQRLWVTLRNAILLRCSAETHLFTETHKHSQLPSWILICCLTGDWITVAL